MSVPRTAAESNRRAGQLRTLALPTLPILRTVKERGENIYSRVLDAYLTRDPAATCISAHKLTARRSRWTSLVRQHTPSFNIYTSLHSLLHQESGYIFASTLTEPDISSWSMVQLSSCPTGSMTLNVARWARPRRYQRISCQKERIGLSSRF